MINNLLVLLSKYPRLQMETPAEVENIMWTGWSFNILYSVRAVPSLLLYLRVILGFVCEQLPDNFPTFHTSLCSSWELQAASEVVVRITLDLNWNIKEGSSCKAEFCYYNNELLNNFHPLLVNQWTNPTDIRAVLNSVSFFPVFFFLFTEFN